MLISTGVDALIKLVREKGKVEITLASRLLNIPISSIEDWAHTLEDEGMLLIEYQLTKVYLKWCLPTEEKIEQERAKFESEKSQLLQKIGEMDVKTQAQLNETTKIRNEFCTNYQAIISRIDEIGKKNAGIEQIKSICEGDYYKAIDTIEELKEKISELKDSVKFMHVQLEKMRNELMNPEIQDQIPGIMETGKEITVLKKELETMEKNVQDALSSVSKVNTDVLEIRKLIELIRKDYDSLKHEINKEKELFNKAESASKLLTHTKEEINTLKNSIEESTVEIKSLNGTIEEIEKNVAKMSVRIKKDEEKIAHFFETLKSTEETLAQYKINERPHSEINELIKKSDALDEKIDKFHSSVGETLPIFENIEKLISNLSELRKKIGEERKKLAEESGAIFALLDKDIATYSTFQKIKEKAENTINDYIVQLEKIQVNYENIEKEVGDAEKTLDQSFTKFRESADYKNIERLSVSMDGLIEKKKLLDEINTKIEALDISATKIAKQVKLLGKEAEILELRASSSVSAENERAKIAKQEIRENITLTEDEQKDFDVKRDELRKLIKKLWEEE